MNPFFSSSGQQNKKPQYLIVLSLHIIKELKPVAILTKILGDYCSMLLLFLFLA